MPDNIRTSTLNKDVVSSLRRLAQTKSGIAVLKRQGTSEEWFTPESFTQWASRLTGIPSFFAETSLAHESMRTVEKTLFNRYLNECETARKEFAVKHKRAVKKLAKMHRTTRGSKKGLPHDPKGVHLVHALIDKLFPHPNQGGKKLGVKGQARKKAAATSRRPKSSKLGVKGQASKKVAASNRRPKSPLEPRGSGLIIYTGAFEMNRRKH